MYSYVLFFILWLIFSWLSGWVEGYYWHCRSFARRCSLPKGEHGLFTAVRSVVGFGFSMGYFLCMISNDVVRYPKVILFILAIILAFSFFHNGKYFCTRNDLNSYLYPMRFSEWVSKTSTAKFEVTYGDRCMMFMFSCILIAAIFLLDLMFNM